MNVLIIEDERPALDQLTRLINQADAAVRIAGTLGSIRESVSWLARNAMPDLILMDIELSDGRSLEIFKQFKITCPVIFTTAYDEYLMDAFGYNGIDYLLKPIRADKLRQALQKYETLRSHFTGRIDALLQTITAEKPRYKERLLVKKGVDFVSIKTEAMAYFYSEFKITFLVDRIGQKFMLDKPLGVLEEELDPKTFFRVNRKYLAHIQAIARFKSFEKGKIRVDLVPAVKEEIHVSQEKAADFKMWMER